MAKPLGAGGFVACLAGGANGTGTVSGAIAFAGAGTATFIIRVTATAADGATIANAAVVTPLPDLSLAMSVSSPPLVIFARPDLRIVKAVIDDDGANVRHGDLVRYRLTVSNPCTVPATTIVITDAVDSSMQLPSMLDGGVPSGQNLSWTIASLAVGDTTTPRVEARVRAGLDDGTIINNLARGTITAPQLPVHFNLVSVIVRARANLIVDKTVVDKTVVDQRGRGGHDTAWVLSMAAMALKLSPELSLLSRYNLALAQDVALGQRAACLEEGSIGAAFRPIIHDRLSVLTKLSRRVDIRPIGLDSGSADDAAIHAFSVEPIVELPWGVQLVEKLALKHMSVALDDVAGSDAVTALWINRINLRTLTVLRRLGVDPMIPGELDLGLEYRVLTGVSYRAVEHGALIEVQVAPIEQCGWALATTSHHSATTTRSAPDWRVATSIARASSSGRWAAGDQHDRQRCCAATVNGITTLLRACEEAQRKNRATWHDFRSPWLPAPGQPTMADSVRFRPFPLAW